MVDLKKYGVLKEKNRNYENIAYVMALVYNVCEKRVSGLLAGYNMSLAQFNVLMVLGYQTDGEAITQAEIGQKLIVSPGSITRLVDKLKFEKLISVVQNKENRRQNLVKITAKGMDLLEKIWPLYDGMMKEMIDLIPASKQDGFSKMLCDWLEKLMKG